MSRYRNVTESKEDFQVWMSKRLVMKIHTVLQAQSSLAEFRGNLRGLCTDKNSGTCEAFDIREDCTSMTMVCGKADAITHFTKVAVVP